MYKHSQGAEPGNSETNSAETLSKNHKHRILSLAAKPAKLPAIITLPRLLRFQSNKFPNLVCVRQGQKNKNNRILFKHVKL